MEFIGTTPTEIAIEKATMIKTAVDTLALMLPLEWTYEGKRIIIEQTGLGIVSRGTVILRNDNDATTVQFKVSVDGVYSNGDGWYGYTNPPIAVPDGTKREVVNSLTGQIVLIDNLKIDPLAAFFEIIEQAVK